VIEGRGRLDRAPETRAQADYAALGLDDRSTSVVVHSPSSPITSRRCSPSEARTTKV
jgi:hypothetical protein